MTSRFRSRSRRLWPVAAVASLALAATGALAATPSSAAPTSAPAAAAKRPPNLVFVLTDDLEPSLLKYMPQVRAMQAKGTNFSNYTVSDSLCCPSRTSILTGQYPHTSGVFTNTGPDGGYAAVVKNGLEKQTFAVSLQQAGYKTGFMGKYINGYDAKAGDGTPGSNVPVGWDDWRATAAGYKNFDYTLNENGAEVAYGHQAKDYLTDVLARKGSAFIRQQAAANKPFALELATFTPHAPYTPAPRDAKAYPGLKAPRKASFNEKSMKDKPGWIKNRPKLTKKQIANIDANYRKRAQSVRAISDLIATVRATLTATGQADNTYLVFSSDNGYHMGEHRLLAGKQTAYATDIVVPLVVTGPGVKHQNTPALAQNIDLAPTFTALAGAKDPAKADGRSLLPVFRGTTPKDWRKASLVEHHGPNNNPSDPDHPTKASGNPPTYKALTTAKLTYVEYKGGAHEYYDNVKDPNQLKNSYGSLSKKRKAALHAQLAKLGSCTGTKACSTS